MGRSKGARGDVCVVACAAIIGAAFGISHPAAAETLNEALAQSYLTNPDLAAAQSRLRQVDEQLSVANANWRPSVSATTSAEDFYEQGKYPGGQYTDSYPTATAEIEAVQPIFSSGRFGAIRGVAHAQIEAERAQLRQTEQRVLLDTIKAFADIALAEKSFDLIREDVSVLRDVLKQTSERVAAHHATETDMAQTQGALDFARAECLSRQAKLLQSWRTYQQLVGTAPTIVAPEHEMSVNACLDAKSERRRSTIVMPDTFPALPLSVEEVEQGALQGAPEVEFAEAKQEEAEHAVAAAYADLLPSAQLTAKLSADRNDSNGPHSRTEDASITAELHIPVFNGGVEWSAIRAAREHGGETRLLLESSRRQSTRNAASAWFELTSVQAVKLINKMQVRTQQAAFEGVRAEITNPKLNRSTSDLLLQEHAMLSSQIALAQSDRDEAVAIYALLAAIGKLNARDLELPVAVYDPDANLKAQSGRWIGSSIYGE
jgi:outer membrane protein TolC